MINSCPTCKHTIDPHSEAELLREEISFLKNTIDSLKNEEFTKQLLQEILEERNRFLLYRLYGPTSEKTKDIKQEKDSLFNEAENSANEEENAKEDNENSVTVPEHTRKLSGRKPLPANLPRQDIIHDLPAEKKFCPHDGAPLVRMGEETCEKLDIIPAQAQVLRHIRYKYTCPCCSTFITKAQKPPEPIEKSNATAGTLAHIAVSKYADGVPLYRLEKIFARFDISISRATLANWMIAVGELLAPLAQEIRDTLVSLPVLHADETTVQVLKEKNKSPQSKSYMWTLCSSKDAQEQAVYYEYHPSRSGQAAAHLLSGFQGFLHVDGYDGYNTVCSNPAVTRVGCWAHTRRKFDEVIKIGAKQNLGVANTILSYISQLYALEKQIADFSIEDRRQHRQKTALPILEKIKQIAEKEEPLVPQKSKLGTAIHYLLSRWETLNSYIYNGALAIDNNKMENLIRPFAVGRKSWLFCDSTKGAYASATLYSLLISALMNELNPYHYIRTLLEILPAINAHKSQYTIQHLLPWNFKLYFKEH